ncbi:MAG: carboxyl transferase domain-containing protein [Sciscionella sp.]
MHKLIDPYFAAERGLADDIIDPADTRTVLVRSLAMLRTKRATLPDRKHGNPPILPTVRRGSTKDRADCPRHGFCDHGCSLGRSVRGVHPRCSRPRAMSLSDPLRGALEVRSTPARRVPCVTGSPATRGPT